MTVTSNLDAALLTLDAVEKAAIAELSHQGEEILKLFRQTTKNWDKRKFSGFTKVAEVNANEAKVTVGSSDRIYTFLNFGTSERWAYLSSNWSSQTAVRSLGSSPGRGKVLLRGRTAMTEAGMNADVGIDARKWDEEIVKQRQLPFQREMEASIVTAAKAQS
jgi:hypothetical protein